jgi:hypothetical protein
MMSLLKIACALFGFALTPASEAATITLSTYRFSPTITTTSGQLVDAGLVRIGTLTGTPSGTSIEAIDLVFSEFESSTTRTGGLLGDTVTNQSASRFDGLPIFVWIFDAAAIGDATEHALLNVPSRNPGIGDPWYFPTHVGSGADHATIHLPEFFSLGDYSFTPGIRLEELGLQSQNLTLAPSSALAIPEPQGLALAIGGAAIFLLIRRRACGS